MLNPRFKLRGNFKAVQAEILIPSTMQLPIRGGREKKWPALAEIQLVIRSLGFRPPHRTLLTDSTLQKYALVRRTLQASLLCGKSDQFKELQRLCFEQTNRSITNGVTGAVFRNLFHIYRSRLNSAAFVVIEGAFNSLRDVGSNQSLWTIFKDVAEEEFLHSARNVIQKCFGDSIPSADEIAAQNVTVEQFALWSSIRNTTVNEHQSIHMRSGLTTWSFSRTSFFEQSSTLPIL